MSVTEVFQPQREPTGSRLTQELPPKHYEKGLGTCIMGIYDEKKVKQILNISDDYSVSALIAIGFPASPVEVPKRKTADDVLSVIE